jgi:quercetin dioxygenase-like cupin family protein
MATTETTVAVLSIEDAALAQEGDRAHVRLRSELGIGSFGIMAVRQAKGGEPVVGEHDELGPGANRHEELYVVLKGSTTFTVDGEEIEAPQGTAVFVRDPSAKRKSVANEDGTIVVAVGGRPGEAFKVSPFEALSELWPLYNAQDYEGSQRVIEEMLGEYPGNALALYNLACVQSLQGNGEDAIASLREALDAWPKFKENAAADDDFASIKDDPRFAALVA